MPYGRAALVVAQNLHPVTSREGEIKCLNHSDECVLIQLVVVS